MLSCAHTTTLLSGLFLLSLQWLGGGGRQTMGCVKFTFEINACCASLIYALWVANKFHLSKRFTRMGYFCDRHFRHLRNNNGLLLCVFPKSVNQLCTNIGRNETQTDVSGARVEKQSIYKGMVIAPATQNPFGMCESIRIHFILLHCGCVYQ